MNSLMFLIVCSAKNSLLELRRKPKKLALYILVILFITVMIISALLLPQENFPESDIVYLKGIIFAFFMIFFESAIISGLSQGSTLFGMEDVNLLFVSPVNPRSVLLYGIVRVAKTLALTGVFILFQGANLQRFGVGVSGLFILFAGYLLMTLVTQLLSLLIYSMTNGRNNRQLFVKILAVLMYVPLAAEAVRQFLASNGDIMATLHGVTGSAAMSYAPVLGWASAGVVAFISGETAAGALFFSLLFLTGAVSVAVIYIGKPDYYEDVLVASETLFERKRSLAEGKVNINEQNSKRQVRIKATGVSGQGASALFGKHVRESFRANRFGLWGIPTVLITAGAAIYALYLKQSLDAGESGTVLMLPILGTLMWVQMFAVGAGRGLKETYLHYIYLLPAGPFVKIVWSNLEVMLKATVEGALACAAAGVAVGAGADVIALSALVYALFVFMLVAINFVFMRFTGTDISAGIMLSLYIFGTLFIMVPGIVFAVIAWMTALGIYGALAALAAWELIVALAGFAMSRGILHNCDMAMMRRTGR